ncbi:hypothetical protein BD410DRAFT_837211 [Rickenella mellea]|uniref:Uncharacterized protein n=1 Tax=Rickenella mellea TaxID=50990 RepID=A0A4Y7QDQ0_9AGAM|nr:hypothetical protein BD410DRAFT_837211 [Rickenella mellea]
MATTVNPASNTTLCDKPKFPNFSYCGKNCAAAAATAAQTTHQVTHGPALCEQCHLKPQFSGFKYCGKACAATAKTNAAPTVNANTTYKVTQNGAQKPSTGGTGSAQQQGAALPAQSIPAIIAPLVPLATAAMHAINTYSQSQAGGTNGFAKGLAAAAAAAVVNSPSIAILPVVQLLHSEGLGLGNMCIMCLTLPKSQDDHFCSKECRDEALRKPT